MPSALVRRSPKCRSTSPPQAPETFGEPTPDEVLDGVDTVPVAPPYGMSEGTERLTISNGTVILASQLYAMDAALNAQRGGVRTLADVPLAVDMVAMLDDLDVATAQVLRLDLSQLVDGEAIALAANPDDPESWLVTVLYRPREEEGLDALTTTLHEKADAFAEGNDAEVVDVASRNGFAVATIRTAGPVNGASVQLTLSPSEWDERYSGPNPAG